MVISFVKNYHNVQDFLSVFIISTGNFNNFVDFRLNLKIL